MLRLLHLSDPTLPIGGYAHSAGLETYVQGGLVKDAVSAELYIRNMLRMNIQFTDAAFMAISYGYARNEAIDQLILLDQECSAVKAPSEIRQASIKLGTRLYKIFSRNYSFNIIQDYKASIHRNEADGHYAIFFGLYAYCFDISLKEALTAFYYNATVGMVTNAVKLIPLGQLDGQDILHRLLPLIDELVEKGLQPDRSMLGLSNTGFDIAAMQHERLYSRLYMS